MFGELTLYRLLFSIVEGDLHHRQSIKTVVLISQKITITSQLTVSQSW